MVRTLLFYLLFFLLPLPAVSAGHAAAHVTNSALLNVLPDKPQVEMGKFLSVRIVYIGDSLPENSYLGKWFEDFFIDRRETESENLANGLIQYTEYLRLYPRSTGNKVLGSIALGGAFARPVSIKVMPAIRAGIDAAPHWQSLPESIWQGETIKVSIVQNLLHPSNQIVAEKVLFPGFYVQGPEKEIVLHNNIKKVQLNWLITANNHGIFQLDAPAIVQRGRGRWRFYLPRAVLKVKPLPGYIPATIPVGKLSIQTGILYKDNKPFWWVELHNEGQLPEEVYGIRSQLSELLNLPVESVKQLSVEQFKAQENSDYPTGFMHRYQIAVPEWTWGFSAGAEIVVPYFNVHKGQIRTVAKKIPAVWHISKSWRTVFLIAFVFILLVILKLIVKGLKNIMAWRRYRSLLSQTSQAHKLRKMLLTQGDFLTLEAWSTASAQADNDKKIKNIARKLNALCYERCYLKSYANSNANHNPISVNEIRQQILEIHTFRYWLIFNS